nr:hypothetical protein [Burkholderia lata]
MNEIADRSVNVAYNHETDRYMNGAGEQIERPEIKEHDHNSVRNSLDHRSTPADDSSHVDFLAHVLSVIRLIDCATSKDRGSLGPNVAQEVTNETLYLLSASRWNFTS